MAFDGITMANLTWEFKQSLEGGRIQKIAQPEKDELILTIKGNRETIRLQISASASLPLIYKTSQNKPGPLTAPGFCMLLRKHIGSARIVEIRQPGLERIMEFVLEHLDEMGDVRRKRLIVELMGKHSNIIFCQEDGTVIDSIKRVSAQVSSVREVLPGRIYFIPHTMEKADPLTVSEEEFGRLLREAPMKLQKALYNRLTGISPIMAEEFCYLASIDGDRTGADLTEGEMTHLYHTISLSMEDVKEGRFTPDIVYRGEEPVEFAALPLTCYESDGENAYRAQVFPSMSSLLETYYASRESITRIRQKSADLRRIVSNALERNYKKYDLQEKQLKDTEKRDKYRVYGELLNTYGYELSGGEKELKCTNYYTGKEISIPLDSALTAAENAKKYFDRYGKLKRTFEALSELTAQTKGEIDHLESISASLDIAQSEADLVQIKEELMEYGYAKKRKPSDKKPKITSRPFHYISSDGFHIYVGKNNYQNEELTFKLANGGDWWFHAKGIPGSHVILKTDGKAEIPDRAFEEAGALAAYYSKGRDNEKVEVDYIQKKNIRKVAKAAPGFVIYHSNYSLMAVPGCHLKQVE